MVDLLEKLLGFESDAPLENWKILAEAQTYKTKLDFGQHLQLFNYYEHRPTDEKILKNKYLAVIREPWVKEYLQFQLHKASKKYRQKITYTQKTTTETKMTFGDYMSSVGIGKQIGQSKMVAQLELMPYIETKFKWKPDRIAVKDWAKLYKEWLAETGEEAAATKEDPLHKY